MQRSDSRSNSIIIIMEERKKHSLNSERHRERETERYTEGETEMVPVSFHLEQCSERTLCIEMITNVYPKPHANMSHSSERLNNGYIFAP